MSNKNSSENNYWIAIVLSMVILISYPYFLQWINPKKPAAATNVETQNQKITAAELSVAQEILGKKEGFVEPAKETLFSPFENQVFKTNFSSLGGTITELSYKGERGKIKIQPSNLFTPTDANDGIFGVHLPNQDIDLTKVQFQPIAGDGQTFTQGYLFEKENEFRMEKRFLVAKDRTTIQLDIALENISTREKIFPLELRYAFNYDPNDKAHLNQAGIVIKTDRPEWTEAQHVMKKGLMVSKAMQWSGILKKYYGVIVNPSEKISAIEGSATHDRVNSSMRTEPITLQPGEKKVVSYLIFAGPQRYEALKSLGLGFEDVLYRGFFGSFKNWLLKGLKFFNQYTNNFGWAIILMTLLIKGAFTPLTHMSFESMKKMQALQPKLKSIQERHKNDPQKLNREMMELYKRNKVNPMMGCMPMLLQIPIFIAFYQVLNETIEMSGAPFLGWVTDLSAPDKFFIFPFSIPVIGDSFNILPLLMIGSMVWQQKLTPQTAATPEQAQIMNFMPLIFGFMFYQMPSGLVLYWFVNNMLSIFHQIFVKRMAVVLHHEDRD